MLVLLGKLQFRLVKGLREYQVFFKEEEVCICVGISQGKVGREQRREAGGGDVIFCKQTIKSSLFLSMHIVLFNIRYIIFSERLL